jgi:hypothetical protein
MSTKTRRLNDSPGLRKPHICCRHVKQPRAQTEALEDKAQDTAEEEKTVDELNGDIVAREGRFPS